MKNISHNILPTQKTKIEHLVNDMLERRVIRRSHNSFSALVVLFQAGFAFRVPPDKDAPRGKCNFMCKQISYLGHILDENDVALNPAKLKAMSTWPIPESPKQLKGFRGLTGYYRRFIKGYGSIARPLTALLKKGRFVWNKEVEDAFMLLKQIMLSPPVLALPKFNISSVVETDASGAGIGQY
ncbi:uncharacterized mitochondrial protein AtMg00860-like [Impatiens glandulifera]|uniref:uncharacterized mitochondrial protein AtMg00860-like n=1 Tax=Impatiens glandulifera TaxID=253017 RepID=UPI001FB06153|nr:uncharacterized mitochondrial protein AtMg00860-like [Impatiens glandulifera]